MKNSAPPAPRYLSAEAKRYMGKGLDRHAPDYLLAESASVGPFELYVAMTSFARAAVLRVFMAPTVMTSGSFPGEAIVA